MKKLLVCLGISAVMAVGVGASPALAAPPSEPPNPNAFNACLFHGAPGTVGFPHAPFCPL
jgi:hypothetical protein